MTPVEKQATDVVVKLMIQRLERTYADFIEQKEYRNIPTFFRDHLYSPPNKDARDQALDNLYEKLKSVTGPEMTENIHQLVMLNKLTDELDLDTARCMLEGPLKGHEDLMAAPVTVDDLEAAISQVGRKEDRLQQVTMVVESLQFFFSLSKLPLIKLVMAPIKVAASMVGAMSLVDTMEAGYALSREIRKMQPFLDSFQERESEQIHKLISNGN